MDSRPTVGDMVRRRHRCQCGFRFTSYEGIFTRDEASMIRSLIAEERRISDDNQSSSVGVECEL